MWFLTFLSAVAGAAEVHVPSQYPTVREAVAAADPGDEILVDGDAYLGAGEDFSTPIPVQENLSIRGVGSTRPAIPGLITIDTLSLENLNLISTPPGPTSCNIGLWANGNVVDLAGVGFFPPEGSDGSESMAIYGSWASITGQNVQIENQFCDHPIYATNSTLYLINLTVSAPLAESTATVPKYGAIRAVGSELHLTNLRANELIATDAIFHAEASTVSLYSAQFSDNVVVGTGGLQPSATAVFEHSGVHIMSSSFSRNVGPNGGIFAMNNPTFYLGGSEFRQNVGGVGLGGAAVGGSGDLTVMSGPATVLESTFDGGTGTGAASIQLSNATAHFDGIHINATSPPSPSPAGILASAMNITGGTEAEIYRSAITNGQAHEGGAIRIDGSQLMMFESSLHHNQANRGGAIYMVGNSDVLLEEVDLAFNSAQTVGGHVAMGQSITINAEELSQSDVGIHNNGLGSSFTALGSRFTHAIAANGGVLSSSGMNHILIDQSVIEHNNSGSANLHFSHQDTVQVSRSDIRYNIAQNSHAVASGSNPWQVDLRCNRICENTSDDSAVWFNQQFQFDEDNPVRLLMRNNVWFHNTSRRALSSSLTLEQAAHGEMSILNNSFVGDEAEHYLALWTEGSTQVVNNIFQGANTAVLTGNGPPYSPIEMDYNLFYGQVSPTLPAGLEGPHAIYEAPSYQTYDPSRNCNQNLWLEAYSAGYQQGDPGVHDLSDSDGLYPSSVGAYGGPFACLLDNDGDGVYEDQDCDDDDPDNFPGNVEVCDGQDNNCNGLIDDEDPEWDGSDGTIWYLDLDEDGFGDTETATAFCHPPGDGWVSVGGDCDDSDPLVNPDAVEVCDGIDNDCNDLIDDEDEGLDLATALPWYQDDDLDGYGTGAPALACIPPGSNWSDQDGDCDDSDPQVHPDATEICDGIDNDCNDLIDDEDPGLDTSTSTEWYYDADGDGFGAGDPTLSCAPPGDDWTANAGDCDDSDPLVHPDAAEICDGIDNNCNDLIDDEDPAVDLSTAGDWYLDEDGDGYGAGNPLASCAPPEHGGPWVQVDGDCDDSDPLVNPDATEICDGIDNDCNDLIDDADPGLDESTTSPWFEDVDGDGYGAGDPTFACEPPAAHWTSQDGDCDDGDDEVHPDATEICDGIDNNCNDLIDDADPALDPSTGTEWYHDADGDGFGAGDPTLACLPPGDDWTATDGDCDDSDPLVNPDAVEICDGIDNNCNDLIDDEDSGVDLSTARDWYLDEDEDGFGTGNPLASCSPPAHGGPWAPVDGDCDDSDPLVNPDAAEICDGIDNDCNDLIDDEDPGLDLDSADEWFEDVDGDGFGAGDPTLACLPPAAHWTGQDGDCDDGDDEVHPDATEICDGIDNNCDGLIDDEDPELDTSTGSAWYHDADQDGFGAGAPTLACLPPGDDWSANDEDCDDTDPLVNPDATEICDGIDNTCNGLIDDEDEAVDLSTSRDWYLDADADGFGVGDPVSSCSPPEDGGPWAPVDGDCDDSDPQVHPDAVEICDGIDNDCNDLIDDEDEGLDLSTASTWFEDGDGDGFGAGVGVIACEPSTDGGPWVDVEGDCDDSDPLVHPDATEICDGIDNNCSGLVDDADPALDTSTATTWYPDADQDGVGVEEGAVEACEPPDPTGWSTLAGDCDDNDPTLIDVCELEGWIQGGCNGCNGTGSPALSWLVVLGGLVALRRRRSA